MLERVPLPRTSGGNSSSLSQASSQLLMTTLHCDCCDIILLANFSSSASPHGRRTCWHTGSSETLGWNPRLVSTTFLFSLLSRERCKESLHICLARAEFVGKSRRLTQLSHAPPQRSCVLQSQRRRPTILLIEKKLKVFWRRQLSLAKGRHRSEPPEASSTLNTTMEFKLRTSALVADAHGSCDCIATACHHSST